MNKIDPTIAQFNKIVDLRLSPTVVNGIDLEIECAKIFNPHMTEEEILDLPINKFNQISNISWIENAVPIESFALHGVIWKYKRRPKTTGYNLSIGQTREVMQAIAAAPDKWRYLNYVLNVLYEPQSSVEDPLTRLLDAKLSWVMPFVYQVRSQPGEPILKQLKIQY